MEKQSLRKKLNDLNKKLVLKIISIGFNLKRLNEEKKVTSTKRNLLSPQTGL